MCEGLLEGQASLVEFLGALVLLWTHVLSPDILDLGARVCIQEDDDGVVLHQVQLLNCKRRHIKQTVFTLHGKKGTVKILNDRGFCQGFIKAHINQNVMVNTTISSHIKTTLMKNNQEI